MWSYFKRNTPITLFGLRMDLKVQAQTPSSALVPIGQYFKPRDANKLANVLAPLKMQGCEPVSPPTTSSSSTSTSSASRDKPDNHDIYETHVYFPDPPPDMRREEERLKTFHKWPLSFVKPDLLAQNGFYYLGRGDEVRCAFCKVEVMRWVEGDDPAVEHRRWAPQCSFLQQADSGNVPLESPANLGRDECGARAPANPESSPRMPGPAHPRYATAAARLRSFTDWPRSMPQKPEDLVDAGFFYTGQGDKTKCFYCNGGLKDWEADDIPWEQHARWFDRCAYVQLVKGRDYVQRVITESCALPAANGQAAPETNVKDEEEESTVEDSKLCKICYAEERNVCFVPCGHVVACAKCALSTNKCPMCRRTFQNAVRLYYS